MWIASLVSGRTASHQSLKSWYQDLMARSSLSHLPLQNDRRQRSAEAVETSQSVSARRSQASNVGTSLRRACPGSHPYPAGALLHPIVSIGKRGGLGRETARR